MPFNSVVEVVGRKKAGCFQTNKVTYGVTLSGPVVPPFIPFPEAWGIKETLVVSMLFITSRSSMTTG